MNVIDAFFEASTWQDALTLVMSRQEELRGSDARRAMQRRVDQYQPHHAAFDVLRLYNEILGEFSRGVVRVPVAVSAIPNLTDRHIAEFSRRGINLPRVLPAFPKLTDEHIRELSLIEAAASARAFVERWGKIAEFLVIEQVIFGPVFWRLLFSWAKLQVKAEPRERPSTVIVLHDLPTPRRVCKVITSSDGGFAVTVPYHKARSGSLFKAPRVHETGKAYVSFSDVVPFSASDRVKLAYHADGFVQFSGEHKGKIRSGKEDGKPKGLALNTNPLARPVQSGPSVGCVVWGYDGFEPWVPRAKEATLLFRASDLYLEPSEQDSGRECWSFSFFVFPSEQLEDAVGSVATGDELAMRLPMNIHHRKSIFRVKLIRVSPATVLGVIALRGECDFEAPSGFEFASPSDKDHCMFAIYPPLADFDNAESLDYQPGDGRVKPR